MLKTYSKINMLTFRYNYEQHKKRINIKKFLMHSFILIVLLVLTFLSFFTLLKAQEKNTFYFVEIESFSTHKMAKTFVENLPKNLPKTHIYYNSRYRVFIYFTSSKKHAKSICKSLQKSFPKSNIFSLKISPLKCNSSLNKNQIESIENLVAFLHKFLLSISQKNLPTLINLTNLKSVVSIIKKCQNEFIFLHSKFLKFFATNLNFSSSKEDLLNIEFSFNSLAEIISKEHQLEYFNTLLISISLNFYSFCNNVN